MKKLTEEMLGLSGFRFNNYDGWYSHLGAGSRLCFIESNPLRNLYNLVSWKARDKIYSEINEIVFDKTFNFSKQRKPWKK